MQFYEYHKDSLFYQLERVNVYAILISDKNAAGSLLTEYGKGTPFNELTLTKYFRSFARQLGDSNTPIKNQSPFTLDQLAFELDEHIEKTILVTNHKQQVSFLTKIFRHSLNIRI